MTSSTESTYTLDQFRQLPAADAFLFELNAGRLVREPRPGRRHGIVVARLCRALLDYADAHGGLVTTETGFVLAVEPPTLRGPDVAWLRQDPAPYGDADGFVSGAPDLAVEVVSPTDSATAIEGKVVEYLDAGAREVWVVYPASRRIRIETAAGESRSFGGDDVVVSDLLPDLRLAVGTVLDG